MSVEEQIITISTFSDCNYRRELRVIAFEVRKLEDRIKQLEEMYEGVIGERPDLLGSNVMGLLKRELIGTQKRIKELEAENDAMRADLLLWKDWVEKERGKQ